MRSSTSPNQAHTSALPAVAITHSGARSGIRVTCGAMARHRASASSRLPVALYIRQIQPRAKYGSLSTSAATAASLSARPRPVCWATADVVTTRKNAASPIGSSSSATASSASRRASSHRPSSSRWEHSTRVRYARQDGRSSRSTSGCNACSSARRSMRSPRTAKASIRHRRPHAAYSSVPVRLPRSTASSAIASRSGRWSIARRAACQAWSLRNVASGSSLSGGSTRGSGGPNGLAVATSWARTRAVRTGSLSPSRARASTQSSWTRPATPTRAVVRITVAASARAATSSVRRASSAACSHATRASPTAPRR